MATRASDRPVTTCRACRRRKVKCDREQTGCGQCRAAGITCVFESQRARAYEFVQENPGDPSTHTTRIPDTEELNASSSLAVPEFRLAALESRVKSLSDLVSSLQQSSSGGTSPALPAGADDGPIPFSSSAGYLSQQGGGKVRYINASSWNAMCRDASEIDELLFSQSSNPSEYDAEFATTDLENSQYGGSAASTVQGAPVMPLQSQAPTSTSRFASLWAELPAKEFCDAALKWYFRGYHPLVPLVHVPSFKVEYEHFWIFLRDENHNRSALLPFATLVLSFLYAGTVVGGEQQNLTLPNLSVAETITQLHRLTSRALKLARFPHAPTLDTLRAYLIHQSIRLKEEEPLTSLAFVGLSLRVANILGLHKDPRHFPQLGRIESEVRRRVWWQLVHIDVCLAVAAGLPPLIDLHSWDVQPITELKDHLIDTVEGTAYDNDVKEGRRDPDSADNPCDISATSMVSTSGVLAASKYRFTIVQRRFLSHLETATPTAPAQSILSKLDKLGEQLRQAIERIPDHTESEVIEAGADSAYGSSLILNRWARLLISTYYDQRVCLVSYALSRAPYSQNSQSYHSQTINSAISFLYKCARLSADLPFRRFKWSWPGNHQPLHSLVLLLNDLLSSTSSENVDRIRNVVDVIFALATENSGLVGNVDGEESNARVFKKGGNEVWRYMARLRARAWRKKGWDPANRLSREQASALCQNWSANTEENAELAGTGQSAANETGPASSTVAMDLTTPAMNFHYEDWLHSEGLHLPLYTAGTHQFEAVEGSWMDSL